MSASIERAEQNAAKAAADENVRELHEEAGVFVDDGDDEVVIPTQQPNHSATAPTSNSNDHVKKEAPEMNIQLQR